MFTGREGCLAALSRELEAVRASGRGRLAVLHGRRQVGKSALVTEWLRRTEPPCVYFQATQSPVEVELGRFGEAMGDSRLPGLPQQVREGPAFGTWEAALEAVVAASGRGPVVVVLDELPCLMGANAGFEAAFPGVLDRFLQRRPVLVVVIGPDPAMTGALDDHGRLLHGRISRRMRLDPLTVAEVAGLLRLDAAAAFDAYLVTGGFPKVAGSWPPGASLREWIVGATEDSSHPLVLTGERMVGAELAGEPNAYNVLLAIGSGESNYSRIQSRSGVKGNTLTRALDLLRAKGMVVADDPLSARRVRNLTRYRVADPYLRFWLRFVGPRVGDIDRGRGDLVAEAILEGWESYRRLAVGPVVREALLEKLPHERFGRVGHLGAYWNRPGSVRVDLVGAATLDGPDGPDGPGRIELAGSIKWEDREPFSAADAGALAQQAAQVPGFDGQTILVGVSCSGFAPDVALDVSLGAEDLMGESE